MTNNDQPNTNAETTNADQQPQEDQKLIHVTLKQTAASDEFPAYAQLFIHVCIRSPETRIRAQPLIFSKNTGRRIIQSVQSQGDNNPIKQLQFAPAIQALIQPQYVASLESCLAELEASNLPEGETRFDRLCETMSIPVTPDILKTLLQVYDHISIAFIRAKREMPAHFSIKLTENDPDEDALHFYSREAFREDIVKQRDEFGFLSDHQAAFFLAAITPNGESYPDIPEERTAYDDLVAIRKIEHPCIRRENGKASAITAIQNAHAGMVANPKWTGCENCGRYHCGIHFEVYGVRLFTATDVETAEKIMPLLGSVFINEEQRETLFGQLCSIKAELADEEEDAKGDESDDEEDDLDENEEKAWNGEGSTPASDDDSEEDDENPNMDSLHPAVQPDEINEDPDNDDNAEDDLKGENESDDEDNADDKGSHDNQEASPEPDDDHADPGEGPGEATPEPEDVDGTTPSDPKSPPVTPIPPTLRPEEPAPTPQADDQKAEEPLNAFTEQLRTDPVGTTTAQT